MFNHLFKCFNVSNVLNDLMTKNGSWIDASRWSRLGQ